MSSMTNGGSTYTLSDDGRVLTVSNPALVEPSKMGDGGFRRGYTLREESSELITTGRLKAGGKLILVGTRNPEVLSWIKENWKISPSDFERWEAGLPAAVVALREWEEAKEREYQAFAAMMARGESRFPASSAGEKPNLSDEEKDFDAIDRALDGRDSDAAMEAMRAYLSGASISKARKLLDAKIAKRKEENVLSALND